MSSIYDPELPDGVPVTTLAPATLSKEALTPETMVVVINRGHETLTRKFDGLDYPLHPHTKGLIRMPYGAALHFQKHTTVPGTRDAFSGAEQSYLGILGVDPEELCTPFSPEECERFGQRIEAIDRTMDEGLQAVTVSGQMASGRVAQGRGQSRRKLVRQGQAGRNGTAIEDAMAPPDEPNDAQMEIAATEAEFAGAR